MQPNNFLILLSALAGSLLGLYSQELGVENIINLAQEIAGTFMAVLKMLVIPLIMTSIVYALSSSTSSETSTLTKLTLTGFITLCSFASALGSTLFVTVFSLLSPQKNTSSEAINQTINNQQIAENFHPMDFINNLIPENIFYSLANGEVLSIVFFSILIGLAINKLDKNERSTQILFWRSFNNVMLKVTNWVLLTLPIGIFALSAVAFSSFKDSLTLDTLTYFFLFAIGVKLILFVSYFAILLIITNKQTIKKIATSQNLFLTSFLTSSSAATMPVTMKFLKDKIRIDDSIIDYVIPLGITLNMAGTALYTSIATLFVCHLSGIELSPSLLLIATAMSVITSIAAVGIPSANLFTITATLTVIGAPLHFIAILMVIERPLDMLRTSLNVYGDVLISVYVAEKLKRINPVSE